MMLPRQLKYTSLCSQTIPVCKQKRNMSVTFSTNSTVVPLLWCQNWNIKIDEGKTQAICFSRKRRLTQDELKLNGRNIPFVNNAKYLCVIFDRRTTLILHIEKTAAKAIGTYIRTCSILKSKHLSANIKLIIFRALLRSIII
jgi:hypothetical protein